MLKSRFYKYRELYWSNLPRNSNFGRELFQKSGVQIPIEEGQFFLSCFLFIFVFSIKNWILTHKILFFIFFYQLNINKNRYIAQILFLCNLLIFKKCSLCFNIQFFMDKMKKVEKKEKWQKKLPSSTGIWTPDFWTKISRQRFEFWGRLDQ